MDRFDVGEKETYYQVCAYDKPEQLFQYVSEFEYLEQARQYCLLHNYSYVVHMSFGDIKCKLCIIKVDSEVIE